MDIYLYCLISSYYNSFVRIIIDYISEQLDENAEYQSDYTNGWDYIGCSLFSMYIETSSKNAEYDLQFTKSEYGIETDVSVYLNLFTDTINPGIDFIWGLIKKLDKEFDCNVIVEDNSSKVVYLKSSDKNYIDQLFWNN